MESVLTELSCAECSRLWQDYAEATAEHVRLFQQSLKDRGNDDLAMRVTAASLRRQLARSKITEHELAAHSAGAAG